MRRWQVVPTEWPLREFLAPRSPPPRTLAGSFRQWLSAGYWIFQPKEFQRASPMYRFERVANRALRNLLVMRRWLEVLASGPRGENLASRVRHWQVVPTGPPRTENLASRVRH